MISLNVADQLLSPQRLERGADFAKAKFNRVQVRGGNKIETGSEAELLHFTYGFF